MTFNSLPFAAFLLLSFCLYYSLPGTFRTWILLMCSLLFYGYSGIQTIVLPLIIMSLAFFGGIVIGKSGGRNKRLMFWGSLAAIVGTLVFFKAGFLWQGMNGTGRGLFSGPAANIIVPLGMSYISFQLLGYLIDVYRFGARPEKNLLFFANYIFFFPKIIAGPIERSYDFLPQLKQEKRFIYEDVTYGMKLFAVGLFKKMVIADRLSLQIDQFANAEYGTCGVILLLGIVFVAIQFYADLSGYTDMAIGIARMFGYRLSQNFRQPFFAQSTTDLWRRWHISLSSWFNFYVFTPLSIYLRNLGTAGVVFSIIATFFLIGLWHGFSGGFIVFGLLQGVIISVEMVTLNRRKSFKKKHPRLAAITGISITSLSFCASCMVFRFQNIGQIREYLGRIDLPASIHYSRLETVFSVITVVVLLSYDYFQAHVDPIEYIGRKSTVLRWLTYALVVSVIIYFGYWSQTAFIYKQF